MLPHGPHSIANILDAPLKRDGDRIAVVDRKSRLTYAELDVRVNRAAQAFLEMGVLPFDRVAVCLKNSADIVILFLATQRIGVIWVGIHRVLALPEKQHLLEDAGARVFVGDTETIEGIRAETVVLADAKCWEEADAHRPTISIDPHEPSAIAYTSGTTGLPKGAVHSQHGMLLPGAVASTTLSFDADTRHGAVLPLTILNLMILGPLLAFQSGARLVAIDRTDAEGLADWIREEGVNHFAGVPTLIYDLLTHPKIKSEDLASLGPPLIGGADLSEDLCRKYRQRFGQEITVGYGMTEAPTAVTSTDGKETPRSGACGRAHPQVEILIMDGDRELPQGTEGEVCVRGRRDGDWGGIYLPMLGYWNQPEATKKVLRNGLYHTGDLGVLDATGALTLKGRRSDLIIRGGANVYPQEVERVLKSDDRIADCAVVGAPDPRLGQRIVAFVEPAGADAPTSAELLARCRRALARTKIPETFVVMDALPRNSMGKVVRSQLLHYVPS